jgi:hypothetical protein
MATGGSIESVSLAGRIFAVAADADTNRQMGGFNNEYQANGDGTGRQVKTRVGWSITGLAVVVDDDRGDDEFLQDLQDRKDFYPVAVTYASGAVYQGTGQITGEPTTSSQSTTKPLDLMGPGKLTPQ